MIDAGQDKYSSLERHETASVSIMYILKKDKFGKSMKARRKDGNKMDSTLSSSLADLG